MNVVITGASGFLGGHIAERFSREGHRVIALVRPTSDTQLLKSLGAEIRVASLDQPEPLRIAMKGADVVVHAAAKVDSFGSWREFQRTTIGGTRNLLEAAAKAGISKFIHISSRGVYERPASPGTIYDETSAYGAPYRWSYYARAKIEAEKLVRAAGIPTTIFRPTWVYGPRDVNIFSRLIEALRQRRLRRIGPGENILNLIYVTDAADAVVLAATHPGAVNQIYNLSADELSPTQRQFITLVSRQLDLLLPASTISVRDAHVIGFLGECAAHMTGFHVRPPLTRLSVLLIAGNRRFSNEKLKRELGWQPKVGYEEGIRQTAEWFTASHRARTTTPSTDRTAAPSR